VGRPLEEVRAAWQRTVEQIKTGAVNIPLWEALEACVPLACDGGKLYVGLPPQDISRVPTLMAHQAQLAIRNHFAREAGESSVELVLFEGTDDSAYEAERERETARSEAASQSKQARDISQAALRGWDWISIELQRLHNAVPEKSLPWNLVEYFRLALKVTLQVENEQREAGADEREIGRGLARTLHKIATNVELPLVLVTMEYMKLKCVE
jgi:hypothetical protein